MSKELLEIKMILEVNVDTLPRSNITIILQHVLLIGGGFHPKLQLARLENVAAVTRDARSRSPGSHPAAKGPVCFRKLPSPPWVCLSQHLGWKAAASLQPPSLQTAHDGSSWPNLFFLLSDIFKGFNHNSSRLINDRSEQRLLHANGAGFFFFLSEKIFLS